MKCIGLEVEALHGFIGHCLSLGIGRSVDGGVDLQTFRAGAAATATVGGSPYSIVPSAAVGSGLGNYSIAYSNGSLTVSAATLTVTANSISRGYGAVNPALAASFTGFVNGDTTAVLSGTPLLTTTATAGSPTGP